jgi:chromosome segregation ATPase
MTPADLRKQATALETLGLDAGVGALRQAADEIERLSSELSDANKSAARWITLMGSTKAELGELRIEHDTLKAENDKMHAKLAAPCEHRR